MRLRSDLDTDNVKANHLIEVMAADQMTLQVPRHTKRMRLFKNTGLYRPAPQTLNPEPQTPNPNPAYAFRV